MGQYLVVSLPCCRYGHTSSIGAVCGNESCALPKPLVWGALMSHYPTLVRRRGPWLLIWHQRHLFHCEASFKKQNPPEVMWDNILWWAYHAADMDTLHQLVPSVETSHVLYPNPLSGGSDEVIIPRWFGE